MHSIVWPFDRGIWYTLADFAALEETVLTARRADSTLDADLRRNRLGWIKVRNEELYPTWYFCQRLCLRLTTEFPIGDEGADADVEIRTTELIRRLQITTAGLLLPNGPLNWGHDHMLHMEQLNQDGEISGWGP